MKRNLLAILAGVMLATGITVLAQESITKAPTSKSATKVELGNPFDLKKRIDPRDPTTFDWSRRPKQLDPSLTFSRKKGTIMAPRKNNTREGNLPKPVRAFYWSMMSPNPIGLYSFSFEEGAEPELLSPMTDFLRGYENESGHYFGVSYDGFEEERTAKLYEYDTTDWTLIRQGSCNPGLSFTDIAFDPTTGDVYGCYYVPSSDTYCWGLGNFEADTRSIIKQFGPGMRLEVVACDNNGQYYGIDTEGKIYKINKRTGDMEAISDVKLEYEYFTGGCYNEDNGTIIASACPGTSSPFLVEINPSTGESSLLFQAPNLSLLLVPYYVPEGKALAPAQPGLEISCTEGAQNVDYVLTMPTTLGSGESLSGSISYVLTADGEEVLSGNANPGQVIEGNLPVDVNGYVTFVLKVSNDEGDSPIARIVCFVGTGSPVAPSYVNAYHDGESIHLSWEPVTLSTDAGYMDPSLVQYEITDKEGQIVATDLVETNYQIPFSSPERGCVELMYTVRAYYDGKYSEPISTSMIYIGTLCPPFDLTMDIHNFGRHTVIDANNDERTWIFDPEYQTVFLYGMIPGDDWLISPEFELEAGKIYPFKAIAENNAGSEERMEIKWGSQNTVAGMTDVIAGPTDLIDVVDFTTYLIPEESGIYYVGFHAISPEKQGIITLHSWSIGAPVNTTTPTTVDDLRVLGAWDGTLEATATFKAPSSDITGNPLTKNVDITVKLGEEVIETLTGAQPGQSFTLDLPTELFPEMGYYDFYFICENEDGISLPLRYREFVGPKAPANPTSFSIIKENNEYFTTWSPVTTATDGTDILPSNIKYKVCSIENKWNGLQVKEFLTPEPIAETRYQVYPEETEKQEMVYYGVQSVNLETESPYIQYNAYLLGTPYSLPFKFSTNRGEEKYFYQGTASDSSVDLAWSFLQGIESQDDDGAWVGAYFQMPNTTGSIITGKISLEDAVKPVLSFFEYCFTDDVVDLNKTYVFIEVDGEVEHIYTVDTSKLKPQQWNRISCDLSPYVGKVIRIELCAQSVNTSVSIWDNLQVRDRVDYQMVTDVMAPTKVSPGIPFEVNVKVLNDGEKDQLNPYTVTLYRNGEVVEVNELSDPLNAGERKVITFDQTLGADTNESNEYYAAVSYKDANAQNLEALSEHITVERRVFDIPVVQGLRGEFVDNGVSLSWLPAEVAQENIAPVTEDFEDCEPWAKEAFEWTFVDMDQRPIGGFNDGYDDIPIPGLNVGQDPLAFLVWDTSLLNIEDVYTAHSGNKLLTTIYSAYWDQTSDWAVSPKLSGEEQTISIWARILEPYQRGRMAIYYSMEDSPENVTSFVRCDEYQQHKLMDSDEWTQFTATIPSGAKYFAINSTGNDGYCLLLDDATFIPAAPDLVGYNVYCDGVKLNDAPVPATEFRHLDVDNGVHVYRVNALYDKGVSELSEPVSVLVSGIIVARDMMVSVMGLNQAIHIRGAENQEVCISSLDGKVIYTGNGDATVPVNPDLYMVTVGKTTLKILVK